MLDVFSVLEKVGLGFLIDAARSFSFLTHFSAITRGVIELRDLVFFLSIIAFFLFANTVIVDLKKAD